MPVKWDKLKEALKASGRGAVQGGTLGFSDEAVGLLNAEKARLDNRLPETVGEFDVHTQPVLDKWKEDYAAARDAERSANDAASEAHPLAYGAGQVAGSGLFAPATAAGMAGVAAGHSLGQAGSLTPGSIGEAAGSAAMSRMPQFSVLRDIIRRKVKDPQKPWEHTYETVPKSAPLSERMPWLSQSDIKKEDPQGRYLFHETAISPKKIEKEGLVPSKGGVVGGTYGHEGYDGIEPPMDLTFFSDSRERGGYADWATANKTKKGGGASVEDLDLLKKHGVLNVVDTENTYPSFGSEFKKATPSKWGEVDHEDIAQHHDTDNIHHVQHVEPGDITTTGVTSPDYIVTGPDLIEAIVRSGDTEMFERYPELKKLITKYK